MSCYGNPKNVFTSYIECITSPWSGEIFRLSGARDVKIVFFRGAHYDRLLIRPRGRNIVRFCLFCPGYFIRFVISCDLLFCVSKLPRRRFSAEGLKRTRGARWPYSPAKANKMNARKKKKKKEHTFLIRTTAGTKSITTVTRGRNITKYIIIIVPL